MNRDDPHEPLLLPGILRLFLMALTLLLFVIGLWAGLARLGWRFAITSEYFANQHGPLLVSGFVGSVIALERAVTITVFDRNPPSKLHRLLRWLIPSLSALGSMLLLLPSSALAGRWILTAASLGMLLMTLRLLDITPNLFTLLMAFGAGGWAFGNILWLGEFQYAALLPAWVMFVVLIIVGERFELDRIGATGRWMQSAFYAGGGLILAGALLTPFNSNLAVRSSGLGCLVLALWLLKHDSAHNALGMTGLSRFSAIAALVSFCWLGLYGILALRFGFITDGAISDAVVHSLFLGFTGGMIIAHAPIILPAILGRRATFWPWLGMVVLGLHLSILVRVVSDLTDWQAGRQWGGLLNAGFGLLYILLLACRLWLTRHSD